MWTSDRIRGMGFWVGFARRGRIARRTRRGIQGILGITASRGITSVKGLHDRRRIAAVSHVCQTQHPLFTGRRRGALGRPRGGERQVPKGFFSTERAEEGVEAHAVGGLSGPATNPNRRPWAFGEVVGERV